MTNIPKHASRLTDRLPFPLPGHCLSPRHPVKLRRQKDGGLPINPQDITTKAAEQGLFNKDCTPAKRDIILNR
jgi:hypothetical protein